MKSVTFFTNYLSNNFNKLQMNLSLFIVKILIIFKLMMNDLYR